MKKFEIKGNEYNILLPNGDIKFLGFKKVGKGTEGTLYKPNARILKGSLIKVYHDGLIEKNPELYNAEKIKKLAELRDKLTKTKLNNGCLYINGEFRGTLVHHHQMAVNFRAVKALGDKIAFKHFRELLEALKELEENGIYHIDLIPENVLIPLFKKAQLIDLDGKSAVIPEEKDRPYYKYRMYNGFFNLFLEVFFDKEEICDYDDILEEVLGEYNIKKELMDKFRNDQYNYETLSELLTYVEELFKTKRHVYK